MKCLDLEIIRQSGNAPLAFEPQRVINVGYAGRDQAAVRHHIEELRHEGVAPPPSVPMLFALPCSTVTTASRIETVEQKTSGEVEFVLLVQNGRLHVGIGSDHTDRSLETGDMLKSKQACPNVLGRSVWDHAEVNGHWDRLQLKSWIRADRAGEWLPYQDAAAGTILSPPQILDLVRSRVPDHRLDDMVIFSGTIPLLGGGIIAAAGFRCALVDPVLRRSLECTYEIVQLTYLQPGASAANA